MTDYGAILDSYDDRKETAAEKAEKERKKIDKSFEKHVLKAEPRKKKNTCSANSDLVAFAKHMNSVKKALKAAEKDGFCLDEILDGLKQLEE